jgi:hypothetical protein
MDRQWKEYLWAGAAVLAHSVMNMLACTAVADLNRETAELRAGLAEASARQDVLAARLEGMKANVDYLARRESELSATARAEEERAAAWHETVARIVTRETGGRDYRAAALVAYCVYNGIQSTGLAPETFLQTRQYNLGGYPEATDTARLAVSDVFTCHIFPVPDVIEYYYASALTESPWHESLGAPVLEYAGHRYFTGSK